jgi:hypothetical protein
MYIKIVDDLSKILKQFDISFAYYSFNSDEKINLYFYKKIFNSDKKFYVKYKDIQGKHINDALKIVLNESYNNPYKNKSVKKTTNNKTEDKKVTLPTIITIDDKKKRIRKFLIEEKILTK